MITRESEYEDLDWDDLRVDLAEIYGDGISYHPELPVKLVDVMHAEEEELILLARHAGLKPEDYIK